jgi:hypothetical protein
MTRLTLFLLQTGETYVTVLGTGTPGEYIFEIGVYEQTPSGSTRPRPLLMSAPKFLTVADAQEAGNRALAEIKEIKEFPDAQLA